MKIIEKLSTYAALLGVIGAIGGGLAFLRHPSSFARQSAFSSECADVGWKHRESWG